MHSNISGCILANNHEWIIKRSIRSLIPITDEIIVFCTNSHDRTSLIAKALNIRVISYKDLSTLELKALVENSCKNNWIIIINANEFVSYNLQDEIKYIFNNNIQNRYKAYAVRIVTICSKTLKEKFLSPLTKKVKIYNKVFSTLNYKYEDLHKNKNIHAFYGTKKEVYTLHNKIFTLLRLRLESFVEEINFISSLEVEKISGNIKVPLVLVIIFKTLFTFFKMYLWKRHFVFGFSGFINSIIYAMQKMLFFSKIREKVFLFKQKK